MSQDRVTAIDAPVPAGGIRLVVTGEATEFDGQGATLEVRTGGHTLGRLEYPEGHATVQELGLDTLPAGRAELELVFINDAMDGDRDRNLQLESVEVHAARPGDAADRRSTMRNLVSGANVVLISVDTLRADHLGSYGYSRDTSPHIDRLARAGVRFERAAAASTWTLPSHATLLTGLHPDEHGVNSYEALRAIPRDLPTLATVFQTAGYATGGFAGGRWVTPRFGFDRGFDVFENDADWASSIEDWSHRGEQAARWIASLPPDQPYFLFVHYYQVHAPYWSPEATRGRFLGARAAPESAASPFAGGMPTSDELDTQIDLYDEDIAAVDMGVGQLLRALRETRPGDEPLIVLTADHGEEFFEHGGTGHGQPHREVLHVPLVISHPALPGLAVPTVSQPVSSARVASTITELVGLEAPAPDPDRSLLGVMAGTPEPAAIALAGSARAPDGYQVLWRPGRSLIEWRGRVRLYDVDRHPGEALDLIAHDPGAAGAASAALATAFDRLEPIGTWRSVQLDGETTQQLRALGYLR